MVSNEYFIKWQGNDNTGNTWPNTWEPAENCVNCKGMIELYHSSQQEEAHAAISKAPISYKQAMEGTDSKEWKRARDKEYKNMVDNEVWEQVASKAGEIIIPFIINFANKYDRDGKLEKRKVRLCADGRKQRPCIDFKETYAPVVPSAVMRMAFALAAKLGLSPYQFDFIAAFLNSEIDVDLYMRPPPGFRMNQDVICSN